MPLTLRPDQIKIQSDILAAMQSHDRVVARAPTGSGKTVIGCDTIRRWNHAGLRVWVLVHRDELTRQWTREMARADCSMPGLIASGQAPAYHAPNQICSVATLVNRLKTYRTAPNIIVIDEAHHAAAKTYQDILSEFPSAKRLGLTATPARMDGKPLSDTFSHLILGPTEQELINIGALSDYVIRTIPLTVTDSLRITAGDYNRADAAQQQGDKFQAAAAHAWGKYARDRHTLVFAQTRARGKEITTALSAVGAKARYCDGETPKELRRATMTAFARGAFNTLVTVDLIGEGYDVPAANCVILARATASMVLLLQQMGRCLRPSDRPALILDLVGNTTRLGGPRTPRLWSLHDVVIAQPRDPADIKKTKNCVKCGALNATAATHCQNCHARFVAKSRKSIKEIKTELFIIDDSTIRLRTGRYGKWNSTDVTTALNECKSYDQAVQLQRRLGYPAEWLARRWGFLKRDSSYNLLDRANR